MAVSWDGRPPTLNTYQLDQVTSINKALTDVAAEKMLTKLTSFFWVCFMILMSLLSYCFFAFAL